MSPDGAWIQGPLLPFTEVAIDVREKAAYRDRLALGGARTGKPGDDATWASSVPPFDQSPLIAAPGGHALIARTPTADQPGHQYDVVGHDGEFEMRVSLSRSQHIVGFGPHSVYVVDVSQGGIQHVVRYPWPL
jgi:hypothetical protein